MRRWKWYNWIIAIATLGLLGWPFVVTDSERQRGNETPAPPATSQPQPPPPQLATPSEALLTGYADPTTPPVEDLKKIHRIVTGYFSVVKDKSRYPIGGNADLAAALRGENPNREVFVRPAHPVFSPDGLLVDRWDSPLVVHPEAWGQLELRSAGPDKLPFTADDLALTPAGLLRQEAK